jgi:hypothetical protein
MSGCAVIATRIDAAGEPDGALATAAKARARPVSVRVWAGAPQPSMPTWPTVSLLRRSTVVVMWCCSGWSWSR